MRRITTTNKINEAITNNLLQIERSEIYYKSSRKAETIDAGKFYEDFSFLCESGRFADAVGWYYERDIKTNGYIAECGGNNRDSEIIITVYFGICNGVSKENIERTLSVIEEE